MSTEVYGALYQGENALVPLPFSKTKHTGLMSILRDCLDYHNYYP